mgnify:FL=1
MLIIGSHVSFGKDQLLASVKEAISYNANTFMFYTGAPQNTVRKEIDLEKTTEAQKLMTENNIDINNVVCHAPYIVNPASNDLIKQDFAITFLKEELRRCNLMGIKQMVLHPGSAVNETREEGLNNIVKVLDAVLDNDYDVKILLETMAGKGNECGINLEEINYLLKNVKDDTKLGVCLDICHLNDSGVTIANFDKYLDDFDKLIGIQKVGCVHVNDSKNPISSHKDRHENIGFGTIGFDNLVNVIYNKRLGNIPFILETPYICKEDNEKEKIYPPYKFEISMLRNKEFNPSLLDDIRDYYK